MSRAYHPELRIVFKHLKDSSFKCFQLVEVECYGGAWYIPEDLMQRIYKIGNNGLNSGGLEMLTLGVNQDTIGEYFSDLIITNNTVYRTVVEFKLNLN